MFEEMMHSKNCGVVHDFLQNDRFIHKHLIELINKEFGEEDMIKSKENLVSSFGEVRSFRDYFEMIDARVAEYKQMGGDEMMATLQKKECLILANNFIGDQFPAKVYQSRMVVPFAQVIGAVAIKDALKQETANPLKYIVYNVHDTNISQFLSFLRYWKTHGYGSHVKFASSVRVELLKEANREYAPDFKPELGVYKLRFVYDN